MPDRSHSEPGAPASPPVTAGGTFIKRDGFAPCVICDKPTCYTLNGNRVHHSCMTPPVCELALLRAQNEVMRQVLDSLDTATRMGGLTGKSTFDVGFIWCQNQDALLSGETTWEQQFGSPAHNIGDAGAQSASGEQVGQAVPTPSDGSERKGP